MKCNSIEEVRANIDRIDSQLVQLICERQGYAMQAAGFKKNRSEARVPARIEQIVERVRRMAEECGGSADIVEHLYREMIEGFIALEEAELSGRED